MPEQNWTVTLKESLSRNGIYQFGVSELKRPVSIAFYKEWLRQEQHGQMSYLATHAKMKEEPRHLLSSAKSLVSVALPYTPHPRSKDLPIKHLKIARYARGEDYHHWLTEILKRVCKDLSSTWPDSEFVACVDSKPVLEKEWAARNNLGWIGKNSLLLNKELGSLFFLGEIITNLEPPSPQESVDFTVPDHCGKCSACIEACPTDAIQDNRSLDANKCLSYLNIELNENPPNSLRDKYQSWLFGCDICQEVCPWNSKVLSPCSPDLKVNESELLVELQYILTSSNKRLQKDFKGTPLVRAGGKGLKRSAMAIIGGSKLTQCQDLLMKVQFENEDLQEMRDWALRQLLTQTV